MLRVSNLRHGVVDAGRPRSWPIPDTVARRVRDICDGVRSEGDPALVRLTRELDGADVEGRIRVAARELDAAAGAVPADLRRALDRMAERLRDLHARQLPEGWEAESAGVRFGEAVHAVDAVGCYVPGGTAAYPSTVLMTAIPARVAGVAHVALCTPPREDGSVAPVVLHAARVAGVDAVYRVGGAQAVAAMAFGTASVVEVDRLVGPGNVWVTAAKLEVAGVVGIDGLAGPSELAVVADGSADPDVLAADLVAQAEHDPMARATLISLDEALPLRVNRHLEAEVARASRREIVSEALRDAEALVVSTEDQAAALVDRMAPEHLQVMTRDPRAFLRRVRRYGAAFLGRHTPVSFGDYGVGSNHVLPTMGTARFWSGLRAADFVTVSSFVEASPAAPHDLGAEVMAVARAEGFDGHARAVEVRR